MSRIPNGLYNTMVKSSFPMSPLFANLDNKTGKTTVFQQDVIVLSCTRQRLNSITENNGKYYSIDNKLVEHIQPVDIEQANVIRDYYSKKILVWQLNGKRLSSFRTALAELLSRNGLAITDDLIGIAYSLPDFYNYDCKFDLARENIFIAAPTEINKPATKILKPVFKLNKRRRSTKLFEYWFEVSGRGQPAKITIIHDNPLRPLWDSIYENALAKNESLSVSGRFNIFTQGEIPHYEIVKWNLITEYNK